MCERVTGDAALKKFEFDQALFTYAISDRRMEKFSQHLLFESADLIINYTSKTTVLHDNTENGEIAIIGLCVDSHGKIEREDIPAFLLKQHFTSVEDVYSYCDRFAGKYVILYSNHNGSFLWGDATCSIPINYAKGSTEKTFCATPFDKMTADYFGYGLDEHLKKIRYSAEPSQAMPGELTPYKEVKALLPNQYLDIIHGKTKRVIISCGVKKQNWKKLVHHSYRLSRMIAKEYGKHYELICPITSGYDSRVVYAILKSVCSNVFCFTQMWDGFTEKTADLYIPEIICKSYGQPYEVINYVDTPEQYIKDVFENAGVYNSDRTVKEAYMYIHRFEGQARINGNIVGQIGKSSVTNTVPDIFGTARFFQCKIHNTEKSVKNELSHYIKDMKQSGKNICDLFALENRCGRWGGQEEALYSLCGMNSLNIFNCRELIKDWLAVSRKLRVNKEVHLELLRVCDEKLLQFPFNPDERFCFLKKSWILFYTATFVKQGLLLAEVHYDSV